MSDLTLALDLGSTSFKARLYDAKLHSLGQAATGIAYSRGSAGEVEIAPEEVDRAMREVLSTALSYGAGGSLAALAVTSQAQTFTVLDAAGRPAFPFVSWMDSRAALTARDMAAEPAFAEFGRHSSFGAPIAGLAVCALAHLAREKPVFLTAGDRLCFLPTYVVLRLAGLAVIDDNLAAMSGLYSLELGDWWPAALERCGLDRAQLPGLRRVGAIVGSTTADAADWGVPEGVRIVLAGNDQTAGAYGCGVHLDGSLLVTLGTAQVAYRARPDLPPAAPGLFRGPYPGGRSYQAAVDDGGGSLVAWACSVIAGCASPVDFYELASRSPAGARGVRFAPGEWQGVGPAHGPHDLARSILEYLVATVAEVIRRLEPDCRGERILLAGGGSRQRIWLELLGRELGVSPEPTDADPLLGSARLAHEAADYP